MAALVGYLFARSRRKECTCEIEDEEMLVHGPLTSKLMAFCRERRASSRGELDQHMVLDFNDIVHVLGRMKLTPSRAQIQEMLQCAAECSGRPSTTCLTFGELCLFAVDLMGSSNDGGNSEYHFDKVIQRPSRCPAATPDIGVRYQVFLGGSCNPTTWRRDIVIPILEEAGITFYNPQADHWSPDLIEVEEQAKQSADLCFYVIDNQTRAIASMVEAAYLAASGYHLILVMIDFGEHVEIDGVTLCEREVQDLNRGRIFVCNLMAHHGLPVFTDIEIAARACCKVLNLGVSVNSLGPEDGGQPAKLSGASVGRKLLAVREAFSHCKASHLNTVSPNEVVLVLKSLCLPGQDFKCDFNSVLPSLSTSDREYNFDEFCSIAAEVMFLVRKLRNFRAYFSHHFQPMCKTPLQSVMITLSHWISGCLNGLLKLLRYGRNPVFFREVFLGGSCGNSTWRLKIAIPMLRKHAISFYNPQVAHWSVRFLPVEAEAKAKCSYLLFVIDDSSRSVASLVETAGYIGEGRSIVLCLKFIKDGTMINGQQVTGRALRDYNRGRSYVAEYANQKNVPVFDSEAEATQYAIARLCGQQTVDQARRTLRRLRGSISVDPDGLRIPHEPSLGTVDEEDNT